MLPDPDCQLFQLALMDRRWPYEMFKLHDPSDDSDNNELSMAYELSIENAAQQGLFTESNHKLLKNMYQIFH